MRIYVNGTLTPPSGGGFANPMTTIGDLIAGKAGGVPDRLAAGAAGYILRVASGQPAWREISAAGLAGVRPAAVATREGQTYWSTDAAAGAQLSICVHKGGATYAWELLAYGAPGLPAATGAGEVPLSTGVGTTYAAANFGDEVGAAIAGGIGSTLGQTFIGDGAGGIIPTSADVSAVLAAANAAAARTALGVQDGPRFVSVCAFGSAGIVLDEIGGAQVDPADYAITGRTLSLSLRLYGDVPSGTTATVRLWRLPREAWLVGTAYIAGEVVVSGGSQWRALVNVTGGSAPSEGATWTANTALASVAITAAYPTLSTASVTVPLSAAVYALDAQAVGAGLVTVRGAALRLTWS